MTERRNRIADRCADARKNEVRQQRFMTDDLRALVAGLCLCFLVTAGFATEKTFPTAKALLDAYSVHTRSVANDADQTGDFLELKPTRYFVPVLGRSKASFDLVVEYYRQQARMIELMRTKLPKEVLEQFLAANMGGNAVFVPIIDPESLAMQSSITATASAKYGSSSVEVLMVNGPKGWVMLWDFGADDPTDSDGNTFMMDINRTGIAMLERVNRGLAEGTITDMRGLMKALMDSETPDAPKS